MHERGLMGLYSLDSGARIPGEEAQGDGSPGGARERGGENSSGADEEGIARVKE